MAHSQAVRFERYETKIALICATSHEGHKSMWRSALRRGKHKPTVEEAFEIAKCCISDSIKNRPVMTVRLSKKIELILDGLQKEIDKDDSPLSSDTEIASFLDDLYFKIKVKKMGCAISLDKSLDKKGKEELLGKIEKFLEEASKKLKFTFFDMMWLSILRTVHYE